MHDEEESDATESPEQRADEAEPKQPSAGRHPTGPLTDQGVLGGVVAYYAKRLLMSSSARSVRGSRSTETLPRGGLGGNDDTVERASARKAPRKRERMSTGYIQGARLVGCVSLGFDQRRQVVEPGGFLISRGAEIHVLEIDKASIV